MSTFNEEAFIAALQTKESVWNARRPHAHIYRRQQVQELADEFGIDCKIP